MQFRTFHLWFRWFTERTRFSEYFGSVWSRITLQGIITSIQFSPSLSFFDPSPYFHYRYFLAPFQKIFIDLSWLWRVLQPYDVVRIIVFASLLTWHYRILYAGWDIYLHCWRWGRAFALLFVAKNLNGFEATSLFLRAGDWVGLFLRFFVVEF